MCHSKLIPVNDIPYTINGKKVELVVKNIIEGKRYVQILMHYLTQKA